MSHGQDGRSAGSHPVIHVTPAADSDTTGTARMTVQGSVPVSYSLITYSRPRVGGQLHPADRGPNQIPTCPFTSRKTPHAAATWKRDHRTLAAALDRSFGNPGGAVGMVGGWTIEKPAAGQGRSGG